MGGRTHAGLAQQMPQTGQGLGEPQPEGARLPAPRLNQTHGQKALQAVEMFPDRLSVRMDSCSHALSLVNANCARAHASRACRTWRDYAENAAEKRPMQWKKFGRGLLRF